MKMTSLAPVFLSLGLFTGGASAALSVSFSGGSGSNVSITIHQPIVYQITTAGSGPIIVFDNAGPVFAPFTVGASGLTYSVNGGEPHAITVLAGGSAMGSLTSDDWYTYIPTGVEPLEVGDIITLHAGTLTTLDPYENAVPQVTSIPGSFILDGSANAIGSVIPEPSSLLISVILPGLLCLRRKRD